MPPYIPLIASIIGIGLIDYLVFRYIFYNLFLELVRTLKLKKHGNVAEGIIVDFVKRKDADQRDQYAPVAKFIAANGMEYLVKSDDYRYKAPALNTAVTVCYEQNDPSNAIINPTSLVMYYLFVLLLVVIIVLVVNVAVYWRINR